MLKTLDTVLNKIICDNSLEILQTLPPESVDLIITSPPYFHQREYSLNGNDIGHEKSVDEYIQKLGKIFEECIRVTKNTGSIIFNLGDKYEDNSLLLVPYQFAYEMTKNSKIKLINNITWVKPNPEPRQFKRRLVSSTEPFFHFVKTNDYKYFPDEFMAEKRKPVKKNEFSKIGQSYVKSVKESNLTDTQKRMALKELDTVISEVKEGKLFSFRMKIKGIHSAAYGGYEGGRKKHLETKGFTIIRMSGNAIKKDVIECPILSLKYMEHPAIYPEYLIQELINLTTNVGDVVLDPFVGSGTTSLVSARMQRNYIGIDINKKYCSTSKKRIQEMKKQIPNKEQKPSISTKKRSL
jgi:site-specific DNA-methyltransferase (adenine-specific)